MWIHIFSYAYSAGEIIQTMYNINSKFRKIVENDSHMIINSCEDQLIISRNMRFGESTLEPLHNVLVEDAEI